MSETIDLAMVASFRLGPLLVEPAGLRVKAVDAREEAVEPRVMQVLVVLADAAGEVVGRDELVRRCWDGRIVGDDAINRVIGRLRRMAEGLAGGAFRIETVNRVGYRLIDASPAETAALPPLPETVTVHPAAGAGQRRRSSFAAAALLALLIGGAALWWHWSASRTDAEPGVSIAGFTSLAGTSPDTARAMEEELRKALGDNAVHIGDRHAGLAVAGAVRRIGGELRVTTRLDDVARGQTLWTGAQQIVDGDAGALTGAMQQLGDTLRCGLDAARSRSPRLSDDQITLYFKLCENYGEGGSTEKSLAAGRALTRSAPDFAPAWLDIGIVAGLVLFTREDQALRTEGLAAARQFIALKPEKGDGYALQAELLPASQWAARERLLRRASTLDWINCRCGHDFLGDFLIQSGRFKEALAVYRNAEADKVGGESGGNLLLWRLMIASELSGDPVTADILFKRLETDFGPDMEARRELAMWRGDWRRLALPSSGSPNDALVAPVWHAAIEALATGNAVAKKHVATMVRELSPEGRQRTLASLLAQLGDADGAFALLENSRRANGAFAGPGRYPGLAQPLLWDPTLRPLWRDARFADFLRRAGFIAYWRKTGSRPDACATHAPPDFCHAIE